MAQLSADLSGNANQLRRLGVLQPLINDKLQELNKTIELRRASGMPSALAIVSTGRGKQIMDQIREVSQDLNAEQSATLARTLEIRQHSVQQMRLIVLLGSVLLTTLVGGGFIAVGIGQAQKEKLNIDVAASRDLLETTLYSIGDGVITTDVEGRITFLNHVAADLIGWKGPEARGRALREVFQIVNEYSGEEVDNPVLKVIKTGVVSGLANHTILISKDGRRIPIDDSAAPIRHDGKLIGVVLVFRDISDRRRAERDAAYLGAIVESSDDAIFGKTLDGVIQTWNAGAERVYGYRADEILGHPTTELLPPDRLHEESEILERLRGGERLDHFETVRLRKGGELVEVSLTISPIRDRTGRIIGASQVGRDITEQNRAAENLREAQKLETLGVLAGGIAHDFNNLLTGVLGNASLALEDAEPGSDASARMKDVVVASEKAAQLTRQMLAYSGKGRFFVERVDLSASIGETAPLIKAAVPSTVELRFQLEERLPTIEADVAQIQQLIMNIIINGAEAIPEERPGTVTVATRRQQVDEQYIKAQGHTRIGELTPGLYVLFEVTDTGSGMDEATKSRMFDPFFTTKFTGRGLGLAAVLGIVRGHSGCIRLTSATGRGTVFQVLFPAVEKPLESVAESQQQDFADLSFCGTILVVDDEDMVRRTAKQTLERFDCTVLLAENGARGLDIFRNQADNIDCVLLDLTMPVMSGEETLGRMKSMRSDIPIILSSGYNKADAVRRFEGKGLAGFLQKPYTASALLATISNVTGGSRQK